MATLDLGQVRPVYKGAWDSESTYKAFDFVLYDSQIWLTEQDVSANNIPSIESDYWLLFGAQGIQGIQGEKGDQGEQGIQGPAVSITSDIFDDDTIAISTAGVYALQATLFPQGTRMLFQQAAAPTGWVKDTTATYNDSALRIVTSDTVSTGGSVAFSTAFANKTISIAGSIGSTTLTTATMPSHIHTFQCQAVNLALGEGSVVTIGGNAAGSTSSTGSSGSHTHSFSGTNTSVNLAVKYTDFIICTKG